MKMEVCSSSIFIPTALLLPSPFPLFFLLDLWSGPKGVHTRRGRKRRMRKSSTTFSFFHSAAFSFAFFVCAIRKNTPTVSTFKFSSVFPPLCRAVLRPLRAVSG